MRYDDDDEGEIIRRAAKALAVFALMLAITLFVFSCGQPPDQTITVNAGNSQSDNTQDNSVDNSQDNDTTMTAAPAATDGAAQ